MISSFEPEEIGPHDCQNVEDGMRRQVMLILLAVRVENSPYIEMCSGTLTTVIVDIVIDKLMRRSQDLY